MGPINQSPFQSAQGLHLAGRFAEAQGLYRQILAQNPGDADALHMMGVAEFQQGRLKAAGEFIFRAIQADGRRADFHGNLGLVLSAAGNAEAAIAEYRVALHIQPQYPEARNNLGIELARIKKYEEAIGEYGAAIALRPNYLEAINNLGSALMDMGRIAEGLQAFEEGVRINPNFAHGHNNVGNALRAMGRLEEAKGAYLRAMELKKDFPEAHNGLGRVYHLRGDLGAAISEYGKALELDGRFPGAWSNLTAALFESNRLDDAAEAGKKAVEVGPEYLYAHVNFGSVLKEIGQLDAAIAHWDKAKALDPRSTIAHSNKIFGMHFHPAYDAAAIYAECRQWDRDYAQPLKGEIRAHANVRDPERRLRIGYVSPDFYAQAISHYVVPLLEGHHHDQFEIHCYASVARPDEFTQRIRRAADVWHDVLNLSDQQVAEKIRGDEIDILVDLTMHMRDSRLLIFARKPAPVQATWVAYPSGTGLEAIDYRFTDAYMDPEPDAEPRVYSEKSIRVSSHWGCFDPLIEISESPVRHDGPIVFGSLNNPLKLNEGTLRVWGEVLQAVPDSRMVMLVYSQPHQKIVKRILADCGVNESRIEFVGRLRREEYLRVYDRIDLGLDTLPYNGNITTLDSLWMGVPVVTLVGKTACGRAGMSVLCNAGLGELVARTPGEFVKIAGEWAGDLGRLGHWRRELRGTMRKSALMDREMFVRNFEGALRGMWREWCGERSLRDLPPPIVPKLAEEDREVPPQ
jgi:protein O-GlcNAc transferase